MRTWDQAEQNHCLPARREAISRLLGGIAPQALETLAQATRGCDSRALADAVAEFARDGSVSPTLRDAAPINIETDEVCEGRTSIVTVLDELRAAGFAAYAYPAMRESRRSALLQPVARAVPALFLKIHLFDDNTVFVATRKRE